MVNVLKSLAIYIRIKYLSLASRYRLYVFSMTCEQQTHCNQTLAYNYAAGQYIPS